MLRPDIRSRSYRRTRPAALATPQTSVRRCQRHSTNHTRAPDGTVLIHGHGSTSRPDAVRGGSRRILLSPLQLVRAMRLFPLSGGPAPPALARPRGQFVAAFLPPPV